jgi:hypothetical protein
MVVARESGTHPERDRCPFAEIGGQSSCACIREESVTWPHGLASDDGFMSKQEKIDIVLAGVRAESSGCIPDEVSPQFGFGRPT